MDKLVDYLCIIQVRISSNRLPAKMMLDLAGKTLLQRVYETIQKSEFTDKIVIATSFEESDDLIEFKSKELNYDIFRGSLDNVLERFYLCAKYYNAKNIIRVCGDSALTSYKHLDEMIKLHKMNPYGYIGLPTSIYGMGSEVFTFASLEKAYLNNNNDYYKEHVTPYMKENINSFFLSLEKKYTKSHIRATIDNLEDYIRMCKFYNFCKHNNLDANIDTYLDYLETNQK